MRKKKMMIGNSTGTGTVPGTPGIYKEFKKNII